MFNISCVNFLQSIATAVVQVLYPSPPSYSQWNKRHCGVLCFIKDNVKRSYFFRIFCLTKQELLWEQELYNSFEYHAPRPYFHTFEGDVSKSTYLFLLLSELYFCLSVGKPGWSQFCRTSWSRILSSCC